MIDNKEEEESREISEEKDEDFMTQEDFMKIIKNFEENIDRFDRETRENTRKLNEIEFKIKDIPAKLVSIQNSLSALLTDIFKTMNDNLLTGEKELEHMIEDTNIKHPRSLALIAIIITAISLPITIILILVGLCFYL